MYKRSDYQGLDIILPREYSQEGRLHTLNMFTPVPNKGEDEAPQFLDAEQIKSLLFHLNSKKRNLIGEGRVPSVSVKKRNLETLDPKKGSSKDNIDAALPGVGGPSASGGDESDNISVRLQQKIAEEDAHLEAILSATVSSATSKSNAKGDVKLLAGASVPWSKLSEEQFESFYKEGVSLDLGPCQKDRNNGGALTRTLFFRFHLRQLACLQLNVFKYLDRLYKDVAKLRIRTKWESDVRILPDLDGHWSDLKITESYVATEDMAKCLSHMESDFPDAFAKYSRGSGKPVFFNVVFQMVDSCVGLYKNTNAIKGAQSLEMYGYSGKSFSKRQQQQQGGGGGGVTNDLSAIISGYTTDTADDSADATVSASSGLDLFGDGGRTEASEADTGNEVGALFSSPRSLNFEELYEGQLSLTAKRKAASETGKNKYLFVCDKNEAKFDIMDPVVLLAPCKGNENAELMKSMITFLDGRCEAAEDSITSESTEFIGLDQYACFDRAPDLAVNLLMSSPVNIYRVASSLFVGVVCFKLRNINTRTFTVKKASAPGAADRYIYGCDARVTPNAHVNCRFRLDKQNCACEAFCNSEGWTDQIREANAKAALGPAYKPDAKRRHSSHHHVPIDFSWLDVQEKTILAYAKKAVEAEGGDFSRLEYKSVTRYDHLARDENARNSWMRCYPYSSMHTFFCHNILPVWRPNFRFHFKNNKLLVQGRLPDAHRSDVKRKVWGVSQEGNSEKAFDFIKNELELISSDEMLNTCSELHMSLREYSTLVSLAPLRINNLNKAMAKSFVHPLCRIANNRDGISNELRVLKETIGSPIVAKAFAHYEKSVKATGKAEETKEFRRMMQDYAKFCSEALNVNFLMGINKRIFHSVVYNMNGMRIGGKDVKDVGIHQFIVSVDSALVAGDYFSKASAAAAEHTDGIDLDDEFGGTTKPSSAEDKAADYQAMEMFLSIDPKDLLLDDEGDDEYLTKGPAHVSPSVPERAKKAEESSPSKRNGEEGEQEDNPPKRAKKAEVEVAEPSPETSSALDAAVDDDEDIGFDG